MPEDEEKMQSKVKGGDTISLKLVDTEEIDAILDLWDEKLELNKAKLFGEELQKNPFLPYLKENRRPEPLRAILFYATRYLDAFCLIEDPYMDPEFWDSHSDFYGSSFRDYPVACKRIHFFSGNKEKANEVVELLLSGADRKQIETQCNVVWQGYCVLRPTPSFVIGRTALEFKPPNGAGKYAFLKTGRICEADLMNATFNIEAPEFIQQDPNLGRCATASLWVATQLTASKFGTSKFRYGTITRHAMGTISHPRTVNVAFDPANGSSGLTLEEMKNALAVTGLNTLEFTPSKLEGISGKEEFSRICHEIYSFVESGIPVIICIDDQDGTTGHALTIVGHSLPDAAATDWMPASELLLPGEKDKYSDLHMLIGLAAKKYYIHDDARGPYRILEIKSFSDPDENEKEPTVEVKIDTSEETHLLRHALVPVPPIIRCTALEPFRVAVRFFNRRYPEVVDKGFGFIWRSVLVERGSFKSSLSERGFSPELLSWYATLHLPRYLWLFEVSVCKKEDLSACFPDDPIRIVTGEYLLDATCPSRDTHLLSERMCDRYWDYRRPPEDYGKAEPGQPHRYRCFT